MRSMVHRVHNERGFTLAELLAVLAILGALSVIAVLAITNFLDKGATEAANTEVHQAHAAISSCMVDAGVSQLDSDVPVQWDGGQGVVTATDAVGVVFDAANFIRNKHLKATYTVTPNGEIIGVTDHEWKGVVWENGRWKEEKSK